MSENLLQALAILKHRLLLLSALVEKNIYSAIKSLQDNDYNIAKQVIEDDDVVDRAEVELEEECYTILALHQPVASDLRMVISILKINEELERMGDMSVIIAKHAESLTEDYRTEVLPYLIKMSQLSCCMMSDAIRAFTKQEGVLAQEVIFKEKELKEIKKTIRKLVMEKCKVNLNNDESLLIVDWEVSHALERIGERSVNIAEDVIFQLEGKIVRHQ